MGAVRVICGGCQTRLDKIALSPIGVGDALHMESQLLGTRHGSGDPWPVGDHAPATVYACRKCGERHVVDRWDLDGMLRDALEAGRRSIVLYRARRPA